MRSGAIPFRFDIREPLKKLQRFAQGHVGEVTLNLPFFSIAVNPTGREKEISRELVIRLKDRRVLSAYECCDNCISEALTSLQEIRRLLIDKEVALSDIEDGPLFLLMEAMVDGIRQFLTFEQWLGAAGKVGTPRHRDRYERSYEIRQRYFDALELLRGHLGVCLTQIAEIAGMKVPEGGLVRNYKGIWLIAAYETLELAENEPNPPDKIP
jgi:hypothetical protein